MIIEQIIKYRAVIHWFLDFPDKGVWYYFHKQEGWVLTHKPNWNLDNMYVQNDEYAEYRKALAEGKTIQFLQTCTGTHSIEPKQWLDWNSYGEYFDKHTQYRVKPEEPKFKTGEWVTVNNSMPLQFKRFTGDLPKWNKELDYEVVEFINCSMKYQISNFDRSIVKHWKPKQDELCVFYDDDEAWIIIAKYKDYINCAYIDNLSRRWDNIAPLEYINTLKDKR